MARKYQVITGYVPRELSAMRKLFLRRLTVDSEHRDRRRKDYNQAIFLSEDAKYCPGAACWTEMTLDMVMDKFDAAVRDYVAGVHEGMNYRHNEGGVE